MPLLAGSTRTPEPTPEARLAVTVSHLTRGLMRLGRTEAKALGLTLPQLLLLSGLRELGAIPVTRWVEEMGVSPSATTDLLDGLEGAGYVRRAHDPNDRRQVLISLTPSGARLTGRIRSELSAKWRTFCRGVSASRLDAAAAVLDQVRRQMDVSEGLACRFPETVASHPPPPAIVSRARSRERKGH